jgi:iduronate 2-sulfatase
MRFVFPMMKASFKWIAALVLGAAGVLAAEPAAQGLNVIHIISDDLNNSLGAYGNPVVQSPNIDRIAARGMRFDRAYCQYPTCNASRTSFLSGRRSDTTRIVDNHTPHRTFLKEAVFLPEYFRQQGYRTLKVGKIFHSIGDDFEDPRSWDTDIREEKRAKNPPKEQILRRQGPQGIVLRARDEDTWEGFVGRKAVEFIEDAARRGRPFFVAAGFRMPHTPYMATEKYYALYDPDELKPRPGPPEHLSKIPDHALSYQTGINPRFPQDRPGDTIAAYYSAISFMDAQVGLILEALDRLNLWDSTVVVFHSDHGYHLGEHGGLWHKLSLFDEAARVPLIMAAPGRMPGASVRLVELVDLYPTLADVCGLKIPDGLEGTSFAPLLEDPVREWKRAVFTVLTRPRTRNSDSKFGDIGSMGRTVFDGRWRFTLWPDGSTELYDHHHDPFEYENLAGDPAQQKRAAEMRKLLADGWKAARGAASG